jgi:hypothetical protein
VLLRAQAAWFVMAAVPSLLLVYDANSCVSFQGIHPWVDFTAIQALFIGSSLPLFAPRILERRRFVSYQEVVVTINALIQLGAMTVHARGLMSGGAGLQTECFRVDFGGVWYLVVVNLGGVVLFLLQLSIVARLSRQRPTSTRLRT